MEGISEYKFLWIEQYKNLLKFLKLRSNMEKRKGNILWNKRKIL